MDKETITSEFGKLGGKATYKKLGKKGMRALGKRGASIRWKKLKITKNE